MTDTETRPLDDLTDGIRIAMLTMDGPSGLSSRPLTVQRVGRSDVWFLVAEDTSWLHPGTEVNLAFAGDDAWVSATGPMTMTSEPDVLDDLGDPISTTWFQEGHDPVALRVDVRSGDWWTSEGALRGALDLAVAKVSGKEPSMGERGTIEV